MKKIKTVICNSLQSFWDMADNHFLEGLDVHCVFQANEQVKTLILEQKERYHIGNISFSTAML